jgi:hypothetical protein
MNTILKVIAGNMWRLWFATLVTAMGIAWVVFELFMKGANAFE